MFIIIGSFSDVKNDGKKENISNVKISYDFLLRNIAQQNIVPLKTCIKYRHFHVFCIKCVN